MSFEASGLVNTHPDIALVQRLDGCLRAGGQNEIGRLDEQLLLQLGDSPADECDHSSLSLPLAMVSGSSAMTRPCAHTRLSRSSAPWSASSSRSWSIG